MKIDKIIIVTVAFSIAAAILILIYLILSSNYCYMENGIMIDNWIDNDDLYIKFVTTEKVRTVWFEDDIGEHLNFTKEHIDLRWCYIKEINDYRIRGVWTW